MTKEEAIKMLKYNSNVIHQTINGKTDPKEVEALDMAIAALEQEPRKGEWLRMSNLSEKEDDRYKCSHCGNVVHYTNKMNLYTFNSWCGRCGSDNGRKVITEEKQGGRMKSFDEVKNELGTFGDCLVRTEKFLEWMDHGSVTSYDGVGEIHDGYDFVTDSWEDNIFDFIRQEAAKMTKEDFINKYPYVAWYNK